MKNKIFVYQGGGYDGCVWEWNAGYFDDDGNYHDLFSSGADGIDAEKYGGRMIQVARTYIEEKREGVDYFLYDTTDEGLKEIADNHHPGVTMLLAQRLEAHDIEVELRCEDCGGYGHYEDFLINPISRSEVSCRCSECHALGSCESCGEYVGEEELSYTDEHGSLCEWCAELDEG